MVAVFRYFSVIPSDDKAINWAFGVCMSGSVVDRRRCGCRQDPALRRCAF